MKTITAENYTQLAIAHSKLNDASHIIAINDGSKSGVDFKGDPKAWGAWRAYWKRIGHRGMVSFMDKNVSTLNFCLTVPTRWPFEFDPQGSTFEDDQIAGNAFVRNYRPPNPKLADAAARVATVKRVLGRVPGQRVEKLERADVDEALLAVEALKEKLDIPFTDVSPELRRLLGGGDGSQADEF